MGPLVPLPFGPVVLWSVVRWYLVRFALCSEALPNRPKHGSTENRITERCSHLHLLTLDATGFQVETRLSKPETRLVRWKKVTLIGVGLLGGSLGLALRQRRLADSVVGFVRRVASVSECENLGAVNDATRDLASAVAEAELIVLCTPIAQMRPLLQQTLSALQPGTIITDVGSVKGSIVQDLEPLAARAGAQFIGSHPMAGAEKMGVAAARADLFENAICVVTPTHKSNRAALAKVEKLWKSVGSRVLRLTPVRHD